MMHNMESDGTEVVEVNFVSFQGLDVPVVSFHFIAIEHVPEKVTLGFTHLEHFL